MSSPQDQDESWTHILHPSPITSPPPLPPTAPNPSTQATAPQHHDLPAAFADICIYIASFIAHACFVFVAVLPVLAWIVSAFYVGMSVAGSVVQVRDRRASVSMGTATIISAFTPGTSTGGSATATTTMSVQPATVTVTMTETTTISMQPTTTTATSHAQPTATLAFSDILRASLHSHPATAFEDVARYVEEDEWYVIDGVVVHVPGAQQNPWVEYDEEEEEERDMHREWVDTVRRLWAFQRDDRGAGLE